MKRKKSKKSNLLSNRRLIYTSAAVLLILGMGVAYWHSRKQSSPPSTTNTSPNSQNIDYSPATKADNAPNEARKGSSTPSSTLNNYQSPPNTGDFSLTITRASVVSIDQSLEVAAIVNGVTSGSCTLNVHKSGENTVSRTENVALQVNSYVCPVIKIPLSDFSSRGDWNVSLTVTSNGKTVTSDWAKNPVSLD
jgi:hypothetical protein